MTVQLILLRIFGIIYRPFRPIKSSFGATNFLRLNMPTTGHVLRKGLQKMQFLRHPALKLACIFPANYVKRSLKRF